MMKFMFTRRLRRAWAGYTGFLLAGLTLPVYAGSADCEGLTYTGKCEGSKSYWCENGELHEADCAAMGQSCGWDSEHAYFGCIDEVESSDHCKIPLGGACINDQMVKWCDEEGEVSVLPCGMGTLCGWNSEKEYFDCIPEDWLEEGDEKEPASAERTPEPEARGEVQEDTGTDEQSYGDDPSPAGVDLNAAEEQEQSDRVETEVRTIQSPKPDLGATTEPSGSETEEILTDASGCKQSGNPIPLWSLTFLIVLFSGRAKFPLKGGF